LESEIKSTFLIGKFNEGSFIESSNKYSASPTHYHYRSYTNFLHHPSLSDQQITESVFIDDGTLHVLKAENKVTGFDLKQFDYWLYSIKLIQSEKQNLELQVSRGRLFYTKSGIFGISSSFKIRPDLSVLKPNPCVDQIKSSELNIEHPPEFAG
jgi:hypothetical protein